MLSTFSLRPSARITLLLATSGWAVGQDAAPPPADPVPRRVEILFLGAPTRNHPGHDPIRRYRILKQHLGVQGINLTYSEDPATALRKEFLGRFDGLMLYANWNQRGKMPVAQEDALIGFVEAGGGFLPIHCASACYNASPRFVELVGGVFQSHGGAVFRPRTLGLDHPITRGYRGFEAWDETYVHARHGADRTILQRRGEEPWTWVRTQGRGRVFYTASGHDMRVWRRPEFHDLLARAIRWAVGDRVAAGLRALRVPVPETMEVKLPGYRQRKMITEVAAPLPPEASLKLAQVPPGFELSLFAAEPDIVNPIAIAWDQRGRAFVVETLDYPNNLRAGKTGNDRIKICVDTDGDGRGDRFTVFAAGLSIPTTLTCVDGGVVCTNGSQVLFLKDTDGDDRADVRQVLFDGIRTGDTHAGTSNFRYGFDNWIWATSGYSGFDGLVGGRRHRFGSGVYRFRPDGSELEFVQATTNNTWGLGFSEEFDVHGSTANANPSFYVSFPRSIYRAAQLEAPRTPRADDNPDFYPSSTDIRQVDAFDKYTAAAGHAFYTARRFPKSYWNRIAFVCGPTGKLVGQFAREPRGAGFRLRQLPNNLYSSADAWSGPVAAEVGPDGAVWICDWYNIVIQHNPTPSVGSAGMDAKRGKGNAYVTPHRDKQHGRIYRVFPRGTEDDRRPLLEGSDPVALKKALRHPNLFWRLTAQRLAVEGGRGLEVAGTVATVHDFYARLGSGSLDLETLTACLDAEDVALRRAALRNAPLDDTLRNRFVRDGKLRSVDPRTRVELLLALGRVAPDPAIGGALVAMLAQEGDALWQDPVLHDAFRVAAHGQGRAFLTPAIARFAPKVQRTRPNRIPNGAFETLEGTRPSGWSPRHYGGSRNGEFSVVEGGRTGRCLRIASKARADIGWGAVVRVQPNSRYRLGGWVRTENVVNRGGLGVMLNVHGMDVKTKGVAGTSDWQELAVEFRTRNQTEILVHCLFGGYGGSTGTAYYDDVYLEELGGGDRAGIVRGVLEQFAKSATASQRDAMAKELAARASESPFAGELAKVLARAAAPAVAKPRTHPVDAAVHREGRRVYQQTCVACHGPKGRGIPAAFPPLDGSSWLTGAPEVPIRAVLHGVLGPIEVNGARFVGAMPGLPHLTDAEIAAVVTYARQSWSNDAAPVRESTVAAVRKRHRDRKSMWSPADLKIR